MEKDAAERASLSRVHDERAVEPDRLRWCVVDLLQVGLLKMSEPYKLYKGDCLEIMPQLEAGSVDMILCDLPYGTTQIEWDVVIPFDLLWKNYERLIKPNGAIVLFSSQPFTTDLINSNRNLFRYEIIWKKTQKAGFLNARIAPLRAHENIAVFYKKLPTYNPVMKKTGKPPRMRKGGGLISSKQYREVIDNDSNDMGLAFPDDVIEFSNWNGALFGNNKNATKHPTQKPVDLLSYLIRTYTNHGDLVLDNTMGSGSTGVACWETGRKFIGIEISDEYFAIAEKRIKQAAQQPALLHEAQQSVQRTANAASQQASFITDGELPSKARGATRRR